MRDPRLYDAAVASRNRGWDVDLYVELAKTAAPPVLEIGSGTGRILVALLRAGVDAYGIENDAAMISAGHAKLSDRVGESAVARLQLADVRHSLPRRRYGLVVGSYNVLSALLSERDLQAAFQQAAQVAAPGALLVFDVIVAEALPWSRPPFRWSTARRPLPDTDIEIEESGTFDPETRLHRMVQTFLAKDGSARQETLGSDPGARRNSAVRSWPPAGHGRIPPGISIERRVRPPTPS